jgi:uncharacterized protein YsxB (DUF464 family)
LIQITIFKNASENYSKLKATGHATNRDSTDFNLVCASVSVLVETLLLNFQIMSNVSRETVGKGLMEFELINPDQTTDLIFSAFMVGLKKISQNHKNEIEIIYIKI